MLKIRLMSFVLMTDLKKENNPNSDTNNATSGIERVYKSFMTHTKVHPISMPWGVFSP